MIPTFYILLKYHFFIFLYSHFKLHQQFKHVTIYMNNLVNSKALKANEKDILCRKIIQGSLNSHQKINNIICFTMLIFYKVN